MNYETILGYLIAESPIHHDPYQTYLDEHREARSMSSAAELRV